MRNRPDSNDDPLSDVLNLLQARCSMSGLLVAGGRWARRFATLDVIKFCAITDGACWYHMQGMPQPSRLESGDVLVMNGTRALVLASAPGLIAGAQSTYPARDAEGVYRLGRGADFTMLGGGVHIDADRQALLQSGLPSLVHVRGGTPEAAPLAWLLGQLVSEMKPGGRPGAKTVADGLAQLLFVQTLRAYLARAPEADEGWLKGLGNHRLAGALSGMHRHPARNWTLATLARQAGMSRTTFAEQFRRAVGTPPLVYLTRWRMHLAAQELRRGAAVTEAAAAVGYTSDSAFSSTFKRVIGVPPGRFRKRVAEPDPDQPVRAFT